jgi:hypothetical protein
LASYDPSKWFTSTELIDTIPDLVTLQTEDDLLEVTNGILATNLVGLQSFPRGLTPSVAATVGGASGATGVTGAGGVVTASFIPAPGP